METGIKDLEKKIMDLRKRLPAHSARPGMIEELEELDEQLEKLKESPAVNGCRN